MLREEEIDGQNGFTLPELERRYENALSRLCIARGELEWEWWRHVTETLLDEMQICLDTYRAAACQLDDAIDSTFGGCV